MTQHMGTGRIMRAALALGCATAALASFLSPPPARAAVTSEHLVTGQELTPLAAPGSTLQTLNPGLSGHPDYRAGWAVSSALSPDGKTLLVLTSGYNRLNFASGSNAGQRDDAASNEYVFVYDVSAAQPVQKQVLQVPNSFIGLAFAPDGGKFYVSGGSSDAVFAFAKGGDGSWSQTATFALNHPSFGDKLTGNNKLFGAFLNNGIGILQAAETAGLAVTADGALLAVANIDNHSLSLFDTNAGTSLWEYDLRPYNGNAAADGVAGGELPYGVAIAQTASGPLAYVSSIRDRELVVVPIARTAPQASAIRRIALSGNPNSLLCDAKGGRIFASEDNSDMVAVIDAATATVIEEIPTAAPPGVLRTVLRYTGAAPNGVALSPMATRFT